MRKYRPNASERWSAFALLVIGLVTTNVARAQSRPDAVLLRPVLRGAEVDGVGHAIERVLRASLAEHDVVALGPTPALNLEDLQLAIGCVAESATCLTQVTDQLGVDALLLLEVERAGPELVITLSRFERGGSGLRATSRRVAGERTDSQALDEVDSIVRQAFGLGPATVVERELVSTAPSPSERAPAVSAEPPVLPMLLIGAGVGTLAAGFILGAVSADSAGQYENTVVLSVEDVDRAEALFSRAETEATAANVLLPVGGVLAAAGAAVWIVQELLRDDGEPEVAWRLDVGPDLAMISARGRFGGAR